jgi:adenosylhomocysteine nucleosidase
MSAGILVLTALQSELDRSRAPSGFEVVYTGVGKINAAIATAEALQRHRPQLAINYGTAGKIVPGLRGLCEVAEVVQRDMMAMPLAPRGRTPFEPALDRLRSGAPGVTCGTGDSFVTAGDPWFAEQRIDLVDMELFAVAAACVRANVRWRAFKFITDDANDFAAEHWTANVADGQTLFWDAAAALAS